MPGGQCRGRDPTPEAATGDDLQPAPVWSEQRAKGCRGTEPARGIVESADAGRTIPEPQVPESISLPPGRPKQVQEPTPAGPGEGSDPGFQVWPMIIVTVTTN